VKTSKVKQSYKPPEKIISKNKLHALKGQERAKRENQQKNQDEIMKKMLE